MAEQNTKMLTCDDESMSEAKPCHSTGFHVDMNLIPVAHLKDENDDLRGLGLDVFNQEELEQGMTESNNFLEIEIDSFFI